MNTSSRIPGFTLIELIIVVVVIAILAALMMANIQEIQARVKVARTKSDLKAVSFSMEGFAVDAGRYPPVQPGGMLEQRFAFVTTPVAYISSAPTDPFGDQVPISDWWSTRFRTYEIVTDSHPYHQAMFSHPIYGFNHLVDPTAKYYIAGQGPDLIRNDTLGDPALFWLPYDPTNGTLSMGDLFKCGPSGLIHGG